MSHNPLSPGDFWRPIEIGGRQRHYLVHVPPTYNPERAWPTVFALHGATSNPRLMEKFTQLSEKADQAGFLLVYPAGTGNSSTVLTWNGGNGYGYAATHDVDDVGFLCALVDDLTQVARVDPRRVYLAGMSNGAQMSYRLAAEEPGRFAAVMGVAGPIGLSSPPPRGSIPVLHVHGTDDQFAPFHGGKGAKSVYGAEFVSVAQTMKTWAAANRCEASPTEVVLPPKVSDGTRIIRHDYTPNPGGAETTLYVVEGGGHTWPGRPPLPPILGVSTNNLIANDLLWEFFERHRR